MTNDEARAQFDTSELAVIDTYLAGKTDAPYRVELEDTSCEACGHGQQWIVVGPDGVGGSTSYGDMDDADHLAEMLNNAYALGSAATKATPPKYPPSVDVS